MNLLAYRRADEHITFDQIFLATAAALVVKLGIDQDLYQPRVSAHADVPLSGHITKRGDFGYRTLREFGPNDGRTLLADELVPHAVPLLMPGIDHFLGPHGDQEIWGAAVMRVFLAQVAGQRNP